MFSIIFSLREYFSDIFVMTRMHVPYHSPICESAASQILGMLAYFHRKCDELLEVENMKKT